MTCYVGLWSGKNGHVQKATAVASAAGHKHKTTHTLTYCSRSGEKRPNQEDLHTSPSMPRKKDKKAPTQGSHAGGAEGLSAGDAGSDRQATLGGKRSTPEDQQPAPSGKQSAPGDRHPTSGGKQYTPGGQQPNPSKGASNKRAAPHPWKEASTNLLETANS